MTIDLESSDPHLLGRMPDLQGTYPPLEPGGQHLRSAAVYLTKHAIDHIRQEHPERIEWLRTSAEIIRTVIENPTLASQHLEYKVNMGHWSVTLAAPILGEPEAYASVVVSLSNMGGPESDFHQIITAYRSKRKYFFDREGTIKPRWIEVK